MNRYSGLMVLLIVACLAGFAHAQVDGTTFSPQVEQVVPQNETTLTDKLAQDPTGNMLVLVVLFAALASLCAAIAPLIWPPVGPLLSDDARWPIGMLSIFGLGIAFALLAGTQGGPITLLALSVLAVFGGVAWGGTQSTPPQWIVPLVLITGALIAAYMFYSEISASALICGTVGDCNAVQHSAYAHIVGVPISLLSIIGHTVLLLVWSVARVAHNRMADLLLYVGLVLAVAFSLYLTFLEPFVIGAVCVWCLASVLLLLLALWTAAPLGWQASQQTPTATIYEELVDPTVHPM